MPIMNICPANERITAQPRLVWVPPTKVCSNIFVPPSVTTFLPLTLPRADSLSGGRSLRFSPAGDLPDRRRLRRWLPLPAFEEVLPEYQNWTGHENRRVRSDQNADHQRQREPVQHLASEQVQRHRREKRQAAGKHGPAQGLVHADVDEILERLPPQQLQVLANAVEYHDSVVHGVADQGQQRGH